MWIPDGGDLAPAAVAGAHDAAHLSARDPLDLLHFF
jgi:hypothetical protein